MIDIQFIRDNPKVVEEKALQKNIKVDVPQLLGFDKEWRELLLQVEEKRRERNEHAAAFKQNKGKPSDEDLEKGKALKEDLTDLEHKLDSISLQLNNLLKQVPNMPLDEVPVGASEDENVIAQEVGKPKELGFKPKSHIEIGEAKDWIDKKRAAKVAGSRFVYLKGDLVRLEMALMQYGIDKLSDSKFIKEVVEKYRLKVSDKPFVPVLPPALAKTEIYDATARLDKEETTYKLAEDDLWLNASAEHTLVPMHQGETFTKDELPLRYVGYTTAFRREAGSYGKDIEGIIRLHQFNKLEMESFSTAATGLDEHKLLVAIQRELMEELEIPYQLIQKCSADIGGPNASGWDINSWMAGQGAYRETHTADYMTDYQARRRKTKSKDDEGKTKLVHTNDATVFSERPLIAIVENNQTKEGDVIIPKVLQKYMGGREKI
ncbi:serine--tRNA ligase [Candidatus Saccharibacteria bacterium]|nr:serine--tRNA ligase [Candidatus Saccharibacteria bacterium]